jgi:hypothetical protein
LGCQRFIVFSSVLHGFWGRWAKTNWQRIVCIYLYIFSWMICLLGNYGFFQGGHHLELQRELSLSIALFAMPFGTTITITKFVYIFCLLLTYIYY